MIVRTLEKNWNKQKFFKSVNYNCSDHYCLDFKRDDGYIDILCIGSWHSLTNNRL
jgi:hypothetical protein